MLAKAGYGKDAAGGLLAAGGLGAILSPPVLGAAAFLIAEFLKISYLDVILMATIPTLLYYLSLFVMVELDAAQVRHARRGDRGARRRLWTLTRRYGFHFISLIAIIVFMLIGYSPIAARCSGPPWWPSSLSFLQRECAIYAAEARRRRWKAARSACSTSPPPAPRRHHRRRRDADRPRPEVRDIVIAYAGGSLLLTAHLHRADRVGRRPRRAGDAPATSSAP